jgi:methionyl-tRNA formyltransferase
VKPQAGETPIYVFNMMNEVKAIILCNNPIAIPGIREFLFYKKVGAIAVTKRNKEMQAIIGQMVEGTDIPMLILNRKDYVPALLNAIREQDINIGLIMTFPWLIPSEVLSLPQKGFINFHYGLLPQCRGPHPILRHLLNNDADAGITLHIVDEGIDTGPVVMQEKVPIDADDTYGTLQSKLAFTAARQAANLLKILSYGSIIPSKPQDESLASYHEMPGAAELTINWKMMKAAEIVRLVNACNPWNKGAGTMINGWLIGITEAEISGDTSNTIEPGTILACNAADGLLVKTSDNKIIRINIVYTQEGFFSGYRLAAFNIQGGACFG